MTQTAYFHYLYNPASAGVAASTSSPHTDYWVFSPGNATGNAAAALAANANAKILMYSSFLWTQPSTSQAFNDAHTLPWTTSNPNESWFLHKTTTGNPRYGPDSFGNYVLNPNPGGGAFTALTSAVIAHMLDAYSRNGPYDGIFMDGVITTLIQALGDTLEYGHDTTTGYPTNWMQNGLIPYMNTVCAGLKAGGVPLIIANAGFNLNFAAWVDGAGVSRHLKDVVTYFDGQHEESWTDGGSGPAQQQGPLWGGSVNSNNRWWPSKLAGAQYCAANGKWAWCHTKGAQNQQVSRYALGASLLAVNADTSTSANKCLFATNNNTTQQGNSPWYAEEANALLLGTPSGAATFNGTTGVYSRTFANGSVTVNPTSVTQSGIAPWDASITLTAGASAPANTVAPSITGGVQYGSVLTCVVGTWSGVPSPVFTFQWKRNGSNIAAATSASYTIVALDLGTTLTCAVTATNSQGNATATSAGVIAAATPAGPARRVLMDQNNDIALSEFPPTLFSELNTTQSATTYTFALTDQYTVVEGTNAGATTYTIPPNATVAFPVGTWFDVLQYGAGKVSFAAGAGVTLRAPGGLVGTAAQYATIRARQRAANEWVLSGNLG